MGASAISAGTAVYALLDLFDGRWGSSASQIINIALLAVGLASLLTCWPAPSGSAVSGS